MYAQKHGKLRTVLRRLQQLVGKPQYRIIYVTKGSDPCHWQFQKRFCWFFWKNVYGRFSSAMSAVNELIKLINANK